MDAVIRPVMHTLASLTASPGTSVYLLNSYHAIHATTSMLGLEHALTAIQVLLVFLMMFMHRAGPETVLLPSLLCMKIIYALV